MISTTAPDRLRFPRNLKAWFRAGDRRLAGLFATLFAFHLAGAAEPWFQIQVVDEQTGRGVPLVELETVHNVVHVTDSAGRVAFLEPGLMNRRVFFSVRSHGYEMRKDGFGMAGTALDVKAGGSATIKLKRLNVAERLYRVTGGGIYHDSVLLGEPVPLREPVLNGNILGQDSVQVVKYRGKLYWFWGDTNIPRYPLGNFRTTGATSELPQNGGLDPAQGVNFIYFTDDKGEPAPMCPDFGEGVVWIDGLLTINDSTGRERLVTRYMRLKGLGHPLEHGLAVWNDDQARFEKLVQFDLAREWRAPQGHPVRVNDGGIEYIVSPAPWPVTRVRADWVSLTNQSAYEAFTCVQGGKVQRDSQGAPDWRWSKDAEPLTQKAERRLVESGQLKAGEARFQLTDVETGKAVDLHAGSVHWNEFRQRWILVSVQQGGTSYLGEIWYAEAGSPTGPWRKARKVVTHEKYSFYNPTQHPHFDQQGGRFIYFEGTYTHTFSGNPRQTPRYDYNQVMYRLDLSDPRLRME
jgi:hypothetical protein